MGIVTHIAPYFMAYLQRVECGLLPVVQYIVDHLAYHYLVRFGQAGHFRCDVDRLAEDIIVRPFHFLSIYVERVPPILHDHVFAKVYAYTYVHLWVVVLVQNRVYALPHYLDHGSGAIDGVDAWQVLVVGRKEKRQ